MLEREDAIAQCLRLLAQCSNLFVQLCIICEFSYPSSDGDVILYHKHLINVDSETIFSTHAPNIFTSLLNNINLRAQIKELSEVYLLISKIDNLPDSVTNDVKS